MSNGRAAAAVAGGSGPTGPAAVRDAMHWAIALRRERFYWHLLWPSLIVLCIVTLLPTVYLLVSSFTPLNLTRPGTTFDFSEPLLNYKLMLEDSRLHQSFWVQTK